MSFLPKAWHLKKPSPALIIVLVTVFLAIYVIWKLDTAPRTDDAYAYADTIHVTPEVSGQIVEMHIKDNQMVKQGDILFRVDDRIYRNLLLKAQAGLEALNKEITLMQRSVNAQKYGASAASTEVERARTSVKQASNTLKRMEPLLSKGYVSAEEVDIARTALHSAQSQLSIAVLQAQSAAASVSGVDALVVKREILKAEIALAEIELEHTVVRAPFNGRVIGLNTTVGQFATAGHPIFTLADQNHWYVIANFRETELENIKPGTGAKVYLMSDTGRSFLGQVESVGFGVQPDDGGTFIGGLPHVQRSINWVRVAQRFPVRIRITNPDQELFRIGASAIAIVDGSVLPNKSTTEQKK